MLICICRITKGGINILYRIKQFYWYITAKIDDKDINFINKYLDEEEIKLFYKLFKGDQKHSIRVAYDIDKNYNKFKCIISKDLFIKVALLHDIGKINSKLNVVQKSIMVILDKITKGKVKRYRNISIVNIYYYHGDIGYNILKKYAKYNNTMLYLIKNHHNNKLINNDLNILRYYDNLN